MMIGQASKVLPITYHTVGRFRSNSQIQTLFLIQKRFKKIYSQQKKRCEEDESKNKKSRKLVTAASIAIVGTAVAVVIAKHDDDFREWSKEHVPPLDSLVKVVYQEDETYVEFLCRTYKDFTVWIKNVLYNATTASKQPESTKDTGNVQKAGVDKPYKHDAKPLSKHIKELKDLEKMLGRAAKDAVEGYQAATNALRDHNKLIDNIDQLVSKQDLKAWESLEKKKEDEEKHLKKAEEGRQIYQDMMAKFIGKVDADSDLPQEMKDKAKQNSNQMMKDVNKSKENYDKEIERTLAKRSWNKVKQARLHFAEELETLFPNVWLNDEKLKIPLDSLDPFIQNVLTDLAYLNKELVKLQTLQEDKINSAIEKLKQSANHENLVQVIVDIESSKELRRRQEELQKLLLTQKAKCDKQARSSMKQQLDVYKDLRAEAITLKEKDVERKMQQLLDERLVQVRLQFQMEIAKMVGRIEGANDALSKRGNKDQEAQDKQKFWSAAQSLLAAAKPHVNAKDDKPKPLKNEITNISKTAPKDDELVEKVVDSIPPQAAERGVESEVTLKERFLKMEKDVRHLAGVPEGHVTLLQLLLAKAQSILYINQPIPDMELQNEPINIEELNNYEILQRARFYVDRGEFDQAVKYLNLLKGPCGKVADGWIKDVLVYLETVQAAELLLAHASALSVQ